MKKQTYVGTIAMVLCIISCKTIEEGSMAYLEEKRIAIEALASKYAAQNPHDIFHWDELNSGLDQKGVLERFDLVKYELCLQNWVEYSHQRKLLWIDSGCEALHNECLAILKAPEQKPGDNWPKFLQFREDNKARFEACKANQEILKEASISTAKPCFELQELIYGTNPGFSKKTGG